MERKNIHRSGPVQHGKSNDFGAAVKILTSIERKGFRDELVRLGIRRPRPPGQSHQRSNVNSAIQAVGAEKKKESYEVGRKRAKRVAQKLTQSKAKLQISLARDLQTKAAKLIINCSTVPGSGADTYQQSNYKPNQTEVTLNTRFSGLKSSPSRCPPSAIPSCAVAEHYTCCIHLMPQPVVSCPGYCTFSKSLSHNPFAAYANPQCNRRSLNPDNFHIY